MKFTLSWLKDYLDTDEPLDKLADKLTMIGLEVEHIDDKAKALAAFTIAKVISAEQHPNNTTPTAYAASANPPISKKPAISVQWRAIRMNHSSSLTNVILSEPGFPTHAMFA